MIALVAQFIRSIFASRYVPKFEAMTFDAMRSANWTSMVESAVKL